jgi:signal transduction histidine kinase
MLGETELAIAGDLAAAASITLENARLYRETQEANRLKNEFVAVVSHELRTPLTPILGCVHLLKTAKLTESNFARALEMIERNAQAQVQIVEDLLDVTRMVAGKLRLIVKPVDPLPLVESAVEAVQPIADSKDIRIVSNLEASGDQLEADPDRLRQVVWNLLSNAVKFTPAGGSIEVGLRWIDNSVEIKVADTGVGISPEVLPYLFDRFRRADDPSAKLRSGLGLGLAIVKHVVELHNGTVIAASPGAGGGAVFTLTFPLQARKAANSTS